VVHYRSFRNTDPPALMTIWNEALTGRGAVRLRNSLPLENCVFAKLYFDPAGLVVAEEDSQLVGFGHAGFGANAAESALSYAQGVICMLLVRPAWQRRGIGSELLRRCEAYLRQHGAQTIYAGAHRPLDPFYFGLYGGSDLPGVLDSDAAAGAFLRRHGYVPGPARRIYHGRLANLAKSAGLSHPLRSRLELCVEVAPARALTWWRNCVLGLVEPLRFRLQERSSGATVASALVYELEGFSWRWNQPAIGLLEVQVEPSWRRQGLARLLLSQIFRYVHEQCFELIELQVAEDNAAGVHLCQSLGLTWVDTGRPYRRTD
jgi:ribosomal protein S18 acetylase RimI-like enzyme